MQFDYITISLLICMSFAKAFFNGSEIHNCQPDATALQPPETASLTRSPGVGAAAGTPRPTPPGGQPARCRGPASELALAVDVAPTHIKALSCPEPRTWGMDPSHHFPTYF